MSHAKVSLGDVDSRQIEGIEPTLRSIGYELQPDTMRPAVWEFERGEATNRHRHEQQEELYAVLEGRLDVEVDDETVSVEAGDYIVVPPESWRQLTATEASRVLVVGAPNVADDAIVDGTTDDGT